MDSKLIILLFSKYSHLRKLSVFFFNLQPFVEDMRSEEWLMRTPVTVGQIKHQQIIYLRHRLCLMHADDKAAQKSTNRSAVLPQWVKNIDPHNYVSIVTSYRNCWKNLKFGINQNSQTKESILIYYLLQHAEFLKRSI